jgi:hypothetical protein
MTERYLFAADFADLLGIERVVNDGDYGDCVAEAAEGLKEVRATGGSRGACGRLRGRQWIAVRRSWRLVRAPDSAAR